MPSHLIIASLTSVGHWLYPISWTGQTVTLVILIIKRSDWASRYGPIFPQWQTRDMMSIKKKRPKTFSTLKQQRPPCCQLDARWWPSLITSFLLSFILLLFILDLPLLLLISKATALPIHLNLNLRIVTTIERLMNSDNVRYCGENLIQNSNNIYSIKSLFEK